MQQLAALSQLRFGTPEERGALHIGKSRQYLGILLHAGLGERSWRAPLAKRRVRSDELFHRCVPAAVFTLMCFARCRILCRYWEVAPDAVVGILPHPQDSAISALSPVVTASRMSSIVGRRPAACTMVCRTVAFGDAMRTIAFTAMLGVFLSVCWLGCL